MQFVSYLNFNGTCKQAFEFYKETFGGEIVAMFTHADTPICDQVGPDWQELIMHARLVVGGAVLMGSDAPPEMYAPAAGLWVSAQVDSAEDAERIFAALAEGGDVRMPIQETFWAVRFGMVTDRFGTPWMINYEKPLG